MSQRSKQLPMNLNVVQESMVDKGQHLVSGESSVRGCVIEGWISLEYSLQRADQVRSFLAMMMTILYQSWFLLQQVEGIGDCHWESKSFHEIAENSAKKSAEHSSHYVMTLTGFGKNLMRL